MNDLLKFLTELPDLFLGWLDILRDPLGAFDRARADAALDKRRYAIKLWAGAFMVTFLVTIPILKAAGGIEWNAMGYHLSYTTVMFIGFLVAVGCVHLGLRWRGIPSQFETTMLAWGVTTATVSVFISVCASPGAFSLFNLARMLKTGAVSDLAGLLNYLAQPENFSYFSAIAAPLLVLGTAVYNLLIAYMIARAYEVELYRSVSAVCFGFFFVGFVPSMLVLAANVFVMYVYAAR